MGTALVALVAGAVGAALTGLLALRRDRVEALRQRQLDAADSFASAAARVLLNMKTLLEALPRDPNDADLGAWVEAVDDERGELRRDVLKLVAHTPRIELLFGIESPPSVAALQAGHDLTQASNALRPPINRVRFAAAYMLAAGSTFRFHDAVHHVVASSWWRRLRHKPVPDDTHDEVVEWLRDEYGVTANETP
ncbi:MAG TPA: hypothetical protein VGH79_07290 [Gaiellaceae bacterium]|jgi:hypothetical protein